MKVYISEITSSLGRCVAEQFRDDNIKVEGYRLIRGSSKQQQTVSGVHRIVNFKTHSQLACRFAIESDLIFLDLRNPTHEPQAIIKFLNIAARELTRKIRVVGISTHMTWEGTKVAMDESGDREKVMHRILQQDWNQVQFKESNYMLRVPNNLFIKHFQLEERLLELNQSQMIQSCVVSCGVLFGQDNSQLHSLIVPSLQDQHLNYWGNGQNNVPITSVDRLMSVLETLAFTDNLKAYYLIGGYCKQYDIISNIAKCCGNEKEIYSQDITYLNKDECIWSSNIIFSDTFNQQTQSTFVDYCVSGKLLADFYQENQYHPKQIAMYTNRITDEQAKTILQNVRNVKIIKQQDIDLVNNELMASFIVEQEPIKKGKKPGSSQQARVTNCYEEAVRKVLSGLRYYNFLVFLKPQMRVYVDGYSLHGFEQISNSKEFGDELVYGTEECYSYLGFKQQKMVQQTKIHKIQTQKEVIIMQKNNHRNEKLGLLNQYINDNVLVYVAEARWRIKKRAASENITQLVNELKQLWIEKGFRSSLQVESC